MQLAGLKSRLLRRPLMSSLKASPTLQILGSAKISAISRSWAEAEEISHQIRERVKKEIGLTISVGVSFNKVFAKLGSDYKKPDATTVITRSNFIKKTHTKETRHIRSNYEKSK